MLINIKLMSGAILEYTPVGVKVERCKIETHRPRIEKMVLEHLKLNTDSYFVKLLTQEDEKEIENIYYSKFITRKSEYYLDNVILTAFVESYDDQRDYFFERCEDLLFKTNELYYSLDNNIRDLTMKKVDELKDIVPSGLKKGDNSEFIRFNEYFEIKIGLENAIWQLSYSCGVPVIIKGLDTQQNIVRKLSKDPTRTIIYYTRSLEECKKKLSYLSD
jgi:hypothetical protein